MLWSNMVKHSLYRCDVLKLAMIKNQFMAEKLFQGNVYDCMCKYEPAVSHSQSSSPSPKRQPQNSSRNSAHACGNIQQ